MRVIIAGSRHMPSALAHLIPKAVRASGYDVTEVVCGMAKGADLFGKLWAEREGLPVKKFPADWKRYGLAAGPIRNRAMREHADALIVFIWDGSRGSEDMLRQMGAAGKPCFVVRDGKLL